MYFIMRFITSASVVTLRPLVVDYSGLSINSPNPPLFSPMFEFDALKYDMLNFKNRFQKVIIS